MGVRRLPRTEVEVRFRSGVINSRLVCLILSHPIGRRIVWDEGIGSAKVLRVTSRLPAYWKYNVRHACNGMYVCHACNGVYDVGTTNRKSLD